MRLLVVLALLAVGCAGPAQVPAHSGPAQQADAWDMGAAALVVATRAGSDTDEVRLGWDVRLDGDRVEWLDCATPTECGGALRVHASAGLLGVQTIGSTDVTDSAGKSEHVEVKRLRFRPPSATRALPTPAPDLTAPQ